MPPRLDPEVRRANKERSRLAWEVANREHRRAYWKARSQAFDAEKRAERYKQQKDYRARNVEHYRKVRRDYDQKNREAIKVRDALGITMTKARRLLAAVPVRNNRQHEVHP